MLVRYIAASRFVFRIISLSSLHFDLTLHDSLLIGPRFFRAPNPEDSLVSETCHYAAAYTGGAYQMSTASDCDAADANLNLSSLGYFGRLSPEIRSKIYGFTLGNSERILRWDITEDYMIKDKDWFTESYCEAKNDIGRLANASRQLRLECKGLIAPNTVLQVHCWLTGAQQPQARGWEWRQSLEVKNTIDGNLIPLRRKAESHSLTRLHAIYHQKHDMWWNTSDVMDVIHLVTSPTELVIDLGRVDDLFASFLLEIRSDFFDASLFTEITFECLIDVNRECGEDDFQATGTHACAMEDIIGAIENYGSNTRDSTEERSLIILRISIHSSTNFVGIRRTRRHLRKGQRSACSHFPYLFVGQTSLVGRPTTKTKLIRKMPIRCTEGLINSFCLSRRYGAAMYLSLCNVPGCRSTYWLRCQL